MRRKRRVRRQVRVVKVGTPGAPPIRGTRPARAWLSKWELVLVVVVAAIWLISSLFPPTLPPVPPPPRINISQDQYDSALARWKRHNIEEYEVSEEYKFTHQGLDLPGGLYTLRVSDSGNKVEVISSTINPYNQAWTVEEMFESVEHALNAERDGDIFDSHGSYTSDIFEFHPEFGYPAYMEMRAITRKGELVGSWENRVTGFKVLKQDMPTAAESDRPAWNALGASLMFRGDLYITLNAHIHLRD